MTSVLTYRVEERGPGEDGREIVLQSWHRDNLDRDEALRLFRILVIGDQEDGRLYSRGVRRLVVVASPATSAPVNAEAAQAIAVLVDAGEIVLKEEIRLEFAASAGAR